MERFLVRIAKDHLTFSAGHFITYGGGHCERLHGHNYRVAAEVEGPLDENQYVVDFLVVKAILGEILDALDHRVMLPTEHATIRVHVDQGEVFVRHADRRWVFPEGDCVLLPVANTTAELLARHIGSRLRAELAARHDVRPTSVRIEVDECFGQTAACEIRD